MEWLVDWLYDLALKYGYLGAFIVSILGNLLPFMPIPYLAAIFLFTANVPGVDPLIVGLVSGLGGGIGKLIVFFTGWGVSSFLSEEQEKQMDAFKKLLGDYGALAAFLFAATPSPDDIIIIPLGLIKYSTWKFFTAITAGKIVISIATSYFGVFFGGVFSEWGILSSITASILFLAVFTWVLFKIDWVKVMLTINEKGWRGFVKIIWRGEWNIFIRSKKSRSLK
ncbi:MAG: hypothetical protein DRJ38_08760 [Thermoprotei archaeon]|nr:MAG: hypothetical protein DRJ38_08760 [Thermoprotei archaeon]